MKHSIKKTVSLLLVLAMLLTMIPAVFAESGYEQGSFSDTITYEWDPEYGDLYISGSGEFKPEYLQTDLWAGRRDSIGYVLVNTGDVTLGDGAFEGLTGLTGFSLHPDAKTVGARAFANCTALDYVFLGYGFTSIGDEIFAGCTALEGVELYASLETIGANILSGCTALQSVHYHGSEESWEQIDIDENNAELFAADISFSDPETCDHWYEVHDKVEPTATTPGYSGDRFCPECGTVIKKGMEVPALTNPFTDVKSSDYFCDAVMWANAVGVTSGTSATRFSPAATCTRAQVVSFLWRAEGSPEPATQNNPFTDVKSTDYFYKAVLWAVEEGITAGTSATKFSPQSTVKREQFVTFLWRLDGAEEQWLPSPYTDVQNEDAYYYDAVVWAVNNGFASGVGGNRFAPASGCTRGQTVTFLERYYMNAPLTEPNSIGIGHTYFENADYYDDGGKGEFWIDWYVYPGYNYDMDKIKYSSNNPKVTVDEQGYITAEAGESATITVSYDNITAQCQVGPVRNVAVDSYLHNDQFHWDDYSITKYIAYYAGTYVNSDGEMCVITQFWVQGYNALGGIVTECMQTLHNLDTNETIRQPEKYYEKMADRYFGATRSYYQRLAIEYMELMTSFDFFPAYTRNEYGLFDKQ